MQPDRERTGHACLSDEFHVDFLRILLELQQDLVDVIVRCKFNHDFQLLHLDVQRIIILAEEDL